MKGVKIKRKWLSMSVIFLSISILLLGFGWINSEVSYTYEVQDTVTQENPLMNTKRTFYIIFHPAK